MTNHETQHDRSEQRSERTPPRQAAQYGDVVECPRCGTETVLEANGPVTCPECGNALAPEPITKGTDAPAPG